MFGSCASILCLLYERRVSFYVVFIGLAVVLIITLKIDWQMQDTMHCLILGNGPWIIFTN